MGGIKSPVITCPFVGNGPTRPVFAIIELLANVLKVEWNWSF